MAGRTQGDGRSRLWRALTSPWNLLGLAVLGGVAALTRAPTAVAAAIAFEGTWLVLATRPAVAARLFGGAGAGTGAGAGGGRGRARGRARARADERARAERRAELVARLTADQAERAQRLEERRREILKLTTGNPHLVAELLAGELEKLDEIVDAFVELSAACARMETHLKTVDFDDLEGETRRYELDAARAVDEEQRRLAKQNLAVLMKRREQLAELQGQLKKTRAQLDLIENTFRMLTNEIMLMRSTRELGGQLDDLIVGVEAVREMTSGGAAEAARTAGAAAAPQAAARSTTTTRRG